MSVLIHCRTFSAASCGLLLLLAIAAAGRQNPPARPQPGPLVVQPLAKNLYLVKGGSGANAGFFVAEKEVILIDAKMSPESAQAMLAEIRKITPLPVTRIILTHSDLDHVNGLPGLPKGLAIIAQKNVEADMLKATADTPELRDYLPTVVYDDKMILNSGRKAIELRHYGPAHTNGDTVVYFEPEHIAFVGDLVFIGRDPLVHGSKNGSASGLVRTLQAILDHKPPVETFVSGHADPVTRGEVEKLITAIEDRQAKVKALIAEGKSLDEIKKIMGVEEMAPPRPGRPRFTTLVEVIYQELTGKR